MRLEIIGEVVVSVNGFKKVTRGVKHVPSDRILCNFIVGKHAVPPANRFSTFN